MTATTIDIDTVHAAARVRLERWVNGPQMREKVAEVTRELSKLWEPGVYPSWWTGERLAAPPKKRKRIRAIIAADIISQRRELLARIRSYTGEKQIEVASRWCLKEETLSRWQSRKGGIQPGQGPDHMIRTIIARELEILESWSRGVGSR